jgi:glycosyltransferase involved in cell wall biosynthesis
VIPAYNEEAGIERCLASVTAYLVDRGLDGEVIVVDDGSVDKTASIAECVAERHGNVRLIRAPHGGKASAVLRGLHETTGGIAGFVDADMATPIETLDICREAIRDGAGVAIASREGVTARRIGEPWYRHAMGRVFNGVVRALVLPGIDDTQCGFKFFTRDAMATILPRCRLYRVNETSSRARVTAFDVELLVIARRHGVPIEVIPVTWSYGAQSKVNPILDTWQNFTDVLRVKYYDWRGSYR